MGEISMRAESLENIPEIGEEILSWYDDGKVCWHPGVVVGHSPFEPSVLAVSLKGDHDRLLYWSHRWTKPGTLAKSYPTTQDVTERLQGTLHTVHHAAFLHHGCQLLLNEPELVVFRTADGELLHCKPKECLIDPDQYGLAARLLSDMSGYAVAPEHIRELAEQMGWSV